MAYKKTKHECHKGFTQIYPNLYVGKESDIDSEFIKDIDILIPLNSLTSSVWKWGWRGEIKYVPTSDFGTLPKDIERSLVDYIVDHIKGGAKIAIFCVGGHGRTGYITSLVLGSLGIDDPIKFLRTKYCKHSVESYNQVKAISEFLNKPNFLEDYYIEAYEDIWSKYDLTVVKSGKKAIVIDLCCDCKNFCILNTNEKYGSCKLKTGAVEKWGVACKNFEFESYYTE